MKEMKSDTKNRERNFQSFEWVTNHDESIPMCIDKNVE